MIMFNSTTKKETENKIQGFVIAADWGRSDILKAVTGSDYVIVIKDCTRKDVLRLAGENATVLRDLKTLDDRKTIPLADARISGETNFAISVSAYIGKKDVVKLQEAEAATRLAEESAAKSMEGAIQALIKTGAAATKADALKMLGLK
jgi:hypothetical protein